MTKIKKKPII
jgi:adenine modification enzyme